MRFITPIPLKRRTSSSFYFLPITENDLVVVRKGMIELKQLQMAKNKRAEDLFIGTLPDTGINFNRALRYSDVAAFGETKYNTDLELFIDHFKFADGTIAYQCYDSYFKPINNRPYWSCARYGIHHPHPSCSWKCLMIRLQNPEYGIIFNLSNDGI